MKTNQEMIRPMGEFKVIQRTKDGFFNATELAKIWFGEDEPSLILDKFKIENKTFLNDMGCSIQNTSESVYLPYHIFVEFVRWCNPMYFIYAFNLCESDNDRMSIINEIGNIFITSKHIKSSCNKNNGVFHTYIIKDGSGLYKIGKSCNIKRRMKSLSIGNPFIELIYEIKDDVETELHSKFYNKRFNGEWFRLTDEDLLYIYQKYPNALPI